MKKSLINFLMLPLMCFSVFTLGFSSWIIKQHYEIGDINVQVGAIKSRDILTYNGSESFSVCKDGMVNNETIVEKCGLSFSFTINNSYLSADIKTITYSSILTMSNINSTMQPYLESQFLIADGVNQSGTLSAFNDLRKTQTYSASININITNEEVTNFKVIYNFKGAFYGILIGDMSCSIVLSEE